MLKYLALAYSVALAAGVGLDLASSTGSSMEIYRLDLASIAKSEEAVALGTLVSPSEAHAILANVKEKATTTLADLTRDGSVILTKEASLTYLEDITKPFMDELNLPSVTSSGLTDEISKKIRDLQTSLPLPVTPETKLSTDL